MMVGVVVVPMSVVVLLAALLNALVRAATVVGMVVYVLVIEVLSGVAIDKLGVVTNVLVGETVGVDINAVAELAIASKFAVLVSYADALSEEAVVTSDILADNVFNVLNEVKTNIFEAVITVSDFVVPAPLYAVTYRAAADCSPMCVLNCTRDLQARMPSNHV